MQQASNHTDLHHIIYILLYLLYCVCICMYIWLKRNLCEANSGYKFLTNYILHAPTDMIPGFPNCHYFPLEFHTLSWGCSWHSKNHKAGAEPLEAQGWLTPFGPGWGLSPQCFLNSALRKSKAGYNTSSTGKELIKVVDWWSINPALVCYYVCLGHSSIWNCLNSRVCFLQTGVLFWSPRKPVPKAGTFVMPPPERKDCAATCAVAPKHSHTQNRQKHMSVHLVMLMGMDPIATSFSGVAFSAWLPIFQGPSPNGSIFLRVLQKQHICRPGLCANHG